MSRQIQSQTIHVEALTDVRDLEIAEREQLVLQSNALTAARDSWTTRVEKLSMTNHSVANLVAQACESCADVNHLTAEPASKNFDTESPVREKKVREL